jgi:hypothetical protein
MGRARIGRVAVLALVVKGRGGGCELGECAEPGVRDEPFDSCLSVFEVRESVARATVECVDEGRPGQDAQDASDEHEDERLWAERKEGFGRAYRESESEPG